MATTPYVESMLGGLDAGLRKALSQIFTYVLGNLRFGRPEHQERAENLQAYFYEATTPSVAGTEFSIAHGLQRAPYLLIPVLPLDTVGAKTVPLEVSKAADDQRLYLKSTTASAPIRVLVEA